jgi:hypothetical protein
MLIGKTGIKKATLVDRPKIYISLFEPTYVPFYDFLFDQTSKFQNLQQSLDMFLAPELRQLLVKIGCNL